MAIQPPLTPCKILQTDSRLDYLDAVRSFALILGVIFHASLSFMPIFIGWAVMDISTSSAVSVFALINHSFRMELFFLIAGFFSHMKFHQQSVKVFIRYRLIKIALPLVIGWFLLKPLIISAWAMGAESMRGDVNILNGLSAGFASLSDLPKEFLLGTHLWFLYYLLVISLSIVLLRFCIGLHKPMNRTFINWGDKLVNWLANSPIAFIVVAVPTTICLWFMDNWGVNTPDKTLVPNMPVLLLYGTFFLFGWLLHRHPSLMTHFSKLTWHKLLLAILAITATVLLSAFEMQYGHEYYLYIKFAYLLSYGIMMWSLVSITIGIFKRLITQPNNWLRYIADASYWLYLIHLPIVLWLQIAFAELPLHWLIKLFSISAITILLSILLYDALIRSTFIGAILNGKRKPRCIFTTNKWLSRNRNFNNQVEKQHLN